MFARLGGQDQPMLVQLWKNWPEVMGEFLSSLGQPRGHKQGTLIVGAADSIAMQELSMLSEELLERANAFLQTEYFTRLSVVLLQGAASLAAENGGTAAPPKPAPLPYTAPPIGALVGRLSPDSPITRCYEAHVRTAKKSGS